ncbi:MAG TPA: type II secretion system protein [Planctomycetota bacterium]|jgi:type II secretory pathway pseudopilin PulG|nr:type II secretion system protein [Planctomycetota bacterium]
MKTRREKGLTLLEVLIAIVVLVLAVSTIMPLFAVASASHKRGMDQAQMAWLAPRVAALLQDRMVDAPPEVVHGFVREMEDGSLLIDDGASTGKLKDDGGAAYRFTATFTSALVSGTRDALGPTCYLLKVDLSTKEAGEERTETYETVVLKKLSR